MNSLEPVQPTTLPTPSLPLKNSQQAPSPLPPSQQSTPKPTFASSAFFTDWESNGEW
ncbi:hypothetical protein HMI56_007633 [Coelomomyces lativittatus]|nr:hypothetical protein HMI56_007633 [Coelomomyces lativittatus]